MKPDTDPKAAPYYDLSSLRVLLVDDDPAVRDVLARYMASAGLEVTQAKDGGDALGLFRQNPL